jgi:hypothetical protein
MNDERSWMKQWIYDHPFVATVVVVATLVLVGYAILRFIDSEEGRPPIIVRGGSITIDNGDRGAGHGSWKKWKQESVHRWKPNHAKGAGVVGLSVTISGASGLTCLTSFTADRVELDYSTGTVNPAVVVSYGAMTSAKKEPYIDSSMDMIVVPESPLIPEHRSYDPGVGYISALRALSNPPSGGTTTVTQCNIDGNNRGIVVTIQPRR